MEKLHDKKRFTNELLTWYGENARDLPWRKDASAYRIWVSEIMLQQTRVEAVKPYFERFLNELPTLQALAEVSDDKLHKLWEGLGYYNRANNMKKCAQECMRTFHGTLPSSYEQLLTLPGIGSYTAGAIASIAFQEKVPAVDGNVLRVFSRVLLSEDDILKESTKKKFQNIIMEYIPDDKSAAFNQAVMEIGALVCVPNAAPRCNICPLAQDCLGHQSGQAHRLPNKKSKKPRRIEKKTILVIVCDDVVYLHQRDADGLLSGLYEFMTIHDVIKRKDIKAYMKDMEITKIMKLHPAKHIFSHVEWHMEGYLVQVKTRMDGRWCTKQELLENYAIPTAFKAYKEALLAWWEVTQ